MKTLVLITKFGYQKLLLLVAICVCIFASMVSVEAEPHHDVNDRIVSKQITKRIATTYIVGEHESLVSAKAGARQKLLQLAARDLPTYITSTKTIENKQYSERIRFIAAGLIKIDNEKYITQPLDNGSLSIELEADVSIDGSALQRKIVELQQTDTQMAKLDQLITVEKQLITKLSKLRNMYSSVDAESIDSKVLQSSQAIRDNYSRVNIIEGVNLLQDVESYEKNFKANEVLNKLAKQKNMSANEYMQTELNKQIKQLAINSFEHQLNRPLSIKIRAVNEREVIYAVTANSASQGNSGYQYWWTENNMVVNKIKRTFGKFDPIKKGCFPLGEKTNKKSLYGLNLTYQNVLFTTINGVKQSPSFVTDIKMELDYLKPNKDGVVYYIEVDIAGMKKQKPFIYYRDYKGSVYHRTRRAKIGDTSILDSQAPYCTEELHINYPWFAVEKSKLSDNATVKIRIIRA